MGGRTGSAGTEELPAPEEEEAGGEELPAPEEETLRFPPFPLFPTFLRLLVICPWCCSSREAVYLKEARG